jgi:hypothetical protein
MSNPDKEPNVKFADGTKMAPTKRATYLGGIITKTAYPQDEIKNRVNIAMATINKLFIFWKDSNATVAWKIQVFNAVIVSQLLYALDSVYVSPAMETRLDAVHIATLRKILKIEHAYISHITNEEILIEANLIKQKDKEQHKWPKNIDHTVPLEPIMRVTEHLKKRRIKLLGHILRTEKDDLMYQATFDDMGIIHHLDKKRTGQPRKKWLQETMGHAFNQYVLPYLDEELQEDFNEFDPEHVQWLQEVAKQRLF